MRIRVGWAAAAVTTLALSSGGTARAEGPCLQELTPEQAALAAEMVASGAYDAFVPPRGTHMIPMTFHVVRTASGQGGIAPSQMNQALIDLNAAYTGTGMQFFQSGPVRYVDNSNYYFSLNTLAEANSLRQVNPAPNTINVYFAPSLVIGSGLCGLSSFTFDPVQGIIMSSPCSGVPGNTTTFAHEVGHYFDLFHTHETMFGTECPSGSNCTTHGDLVCDTPADPELGNDNVEDCEFTEILRLCLAFYNPDVSNLMSYAPESCRSTFTAGQVARMLATLENLRPELLEVPSCPGDVNGDEVVDLDDLQALLFSFGSSDDAGDADGDGQVDLDDLQLVLFNFGTACAT